MMSPIEHLVSALNHTPLGDMYDLVGIINDDDPTLPRDCQKVEDYGFTPQKGCPWFYPPDLRVQGRLVNDLLISVPSHYRHLPLGDEKRLLGKSLFEHELLDVLLELQADVVVLDGLLVILDELVRSGSIYERRVFNIHPGITRVESPYVRRGAYATLDALYGAKGLKVVDWESKTVVQVPVINRTGASFHYVDAGIDSGEVLVDIVGTDIDPDDTILELRWNNFNKSLLPLLVRGLEEVGKVCKRL